MQTLADIRAELAERGLSPKKSLGQNFLIDGNLARKLVDASGVGPGDLVLEVGPGTGVLTAELLARGCRVIACELDDGLFAMLTETLGVQHAEALQLIHADALAGKRALAPEIVAAVGDQPFTLVANLPYQAATPLVIALLADYPRCRGLFVTIQKEVVDRLAAKRGDAAYGSISVLAGCTATVRTIATLQPECFWPRPGVTSAMAGMTRLAEPLTDDPRALAEFCQKVFAQRRKQLGPVLRRMALEPAVWPENIERSARIEQLTPVEIAGLERATRIG
jgi:16S rRNA (adenine1518-N6/adenine1519-N6)-dimethyltransferase